MSHVFEGEIDRISPHSTPYNVIDDVPNSNQESSPFSPLSKTCFLIFYIFFLILFTVFFFVTALSYPLKPELYVDQFYVPAFDKITPNISEEMKNLTFFQLRFNNRNQLISISYDDFLNLTIYYVPNTTSSIYFANVTLPGFDQIRSKPVTIIIQTPPPGMPGLLKLREEFVTMVFRVDLVFGLRFHSQELGKHKHRFMMTANVEVSLETGTSFDETTQLYEPSS